MSDISIDMKFFGAFRKFGESLSFSAPSGSKISSIKKILQDELGGEGLVSDSVLANNDAILRDDDVLDEDVELSILPPVCGG